MRQSEIWFGMREFVDMSTNANPPGGSEFDAFHGFLFSAGSS